MAQSIYVWLLWVSTIIMMVPFMVSWRQLCCVSNVNDNLYQRTVLVVLWITLSLPLNVMLFATHLYEPKMAYWTYFIDCIVVLFGIHIFRIISFDLLDNMYTDNGQGVRGRPRWITISGYAVVTFISAAALCCYGLALFSSSDVDMKYIHIFYAIWCTTIVILGIAIYIVVRPISIILKNTISEAGDRSHDFEAGDRSHDVEADIMSSIFAMKVMHSMNFVVCITAIIHILIIILNVYLDRDGNGGDGDLVECAIHSQTLIVLSFCDVLLIVEKKEQCCFVGKNSLWRMCFMKRQYVHYRRSQTQTGKGNDVRVNLLSDVRNSETDITMITESDDNKL